MTYTTGINDGCLALSDLVNRQTVRGKFHVEIGVCVCRFALAKAPDGYCWV